MDYLTRVFRPSMGLVFLLVYIHFYGVKENRWSDDLDVRGIYS